MEDTQAAREETVPTVTWLSARAEGEAPRPLIKMPGSKRWLVPAVCTRFAQYVQQTGGRFFEPFAGGAAVALGVGALGGKCLIADINRELMLLFTAVRDKPGALFGALKDYVDSGIDRQRYLEVRSKKPSNPIEVAAWTLYLTRLSFNGLWRVNSDGGFNVPYGTALTRAFPSLEALQSVGAALQESEIFYADFRQILPQAKKGDAVYCDPPYVGTFTQYSAGGWDMSAAEELATLCQAAAQRGVAVLISSPEHPDIVKQYEAWTYRRTLPMRHNVAARAKDRRDFPEALYATHPDLIDINQLPVAKVEEEEEIPNVEE